MTDAVLSLIAYSSLLILSQLSPGPDIFFVLRTSLAQGYRAAIAVATGINLGFCLQAIIVCTLGTQLALIEGAFLLVTHDRRFADALARETFAFEDKKLVRYEGGPSAAERAKAAPKTPAAPVDRQLLELRLAEVISRLSLPNCPDKEALEQEFQELVRRRREAANGK